jgi:hypothetical protein
MEYYVYSKNSTTINGTETKSDIQFLKKNGKEKLQGNIKINGVNIKIDGMSRDKQNKILFDLKVNGKKYTVNQQQLLKLLNNNQKYLTNE